jgi:cytoskeletal protein CcmA (bactofilin family)
VSAAEIQTVLAQGTEFEGLLSFRGAARVDGKFSGDVVAEGCLVIGEGARVRARIEVDELIVGGELEGEIHARERVELLKTARVVGSVRSPRLAVAEGGVLEGRCQAVPDAVASAGEAKGAGGSS